MITFSYRSFFPPSYGHQNSLKNESTTSNQPSIVCEVNKVFVNILNLLHLYEGQGVLYDGLHQAHQEQDGQHPLVGQVGVRNSVITKPLGSQYYKSLDALLHCTPKPMDTK